VVGSSTGFPGLVVRPDVRTPRGAGGRSDWPYSSRCQPQLGTARSAD